jgi:hypothetical protein
MDKSIGLPIIYASSDDLTKEIKITDDPIKRIILKRFLEIKLLEMRAESEDPSIDGLSDDGSIDSNSSFNNNGEIINKNHSVEDDNNKNNKNKYSVRDEYESMMKKQKKSLSDLDNISRIKAYAELIEDNKKDSNRKDLERSRGSREKRWEIHGTYDERYIKYQKEDIMNNKLMERLNTEIDFRSDPNGKTMIEKPFNDDDIENTEMFARYEQTDQQGHNKKRVKYVPKKSLGKRVHIRKN